VLFAAWCLISLGELCDHYSFPPGLFKGFLLDAACFAPKIYFVSLWALSLHEEAVMIGKLGAKIPACER